MAWTPADAAISVTPAVEEHMNSLTSPEEIKAYLASVAVDQQLCTRDRYNPEVLLPTALASAAPKRVGKVVRFNGVTHSLVAHDEAGLLAQENAIYREAMAQPAAPTPTTPARDSGTGRFTTPEDAAAQAELEWAFKRGDISASDYLERSGAIDSYLEKAGVPIEDLKASVAEKQTERFTQSWADATEAFKTRHPDWVGGEANRDIIGKIIADNNLVEADDKVAALEAAFNHAKENGLLVENPDTAYQREMSEARSAQDITAVNQKYFGGGIFNR